MSGVVVCLVRCIMMSKCSEILNASRDLMVELYEKSTVRVFQTSFVKVFSTFYHPSKRTLHCLLTFFSIFTLVGSMKSRLFVPRFTWIIF